MTKILSLLIENKEEKYKNFSEKLIPNTKYEILGVRVPTVKKIAKQAILEDFYEEFLSSDKKYYEEILIYGIIIASLKIPDDEKLLRLDAYLPLIDNWAVCDTVSSLLKIFKKNKNLALSYARKLLLSSETYTVRLAVDIMIDHLVYEEYVDEIIDLTTKINSDEYYINMAVAWLYSVIAVKYYDKIVWLFEEKSLPKFIQNKSIQKIIESYRISSEIKDYLKTLKI